MPATLRIRQTGNLVAIKTLKIKHLGVLRNLRTLKVLRGGALRTVGQFVPPPTASANPPSATITARQSGAPTLSAGPVTCNVAGGYAPYTYVWSKVSGETFSLSGPNSAATQFSHSFVGPGVEYVATYRCTVADATGQTASVDVPVSIYNQGGAA